MGRSSCSYGGKTRSTRPCVSGFRWDAGEPSTGSAARTTRRNPTSVSRGLLEEQISLSRALGDVAGIVSALNAIAGEESFIGNLKSARSLFEECLRLSQEAGSELTVAQSLSNLTYILKEDGDLTGAKALAEQALAIFVRLKDFGGAAWLQHRLGDLEREQGNAGVARVWYERALATFENSAIERAWPEP